MLDTESVIAYDDYAVEIEERGETVMIMKTSEELKQMMTVAEKLREDATKADRYACNTLISVIRAWDKQSETAQEAAISCVEAEDCTDSDLRELRS